MTDWTPTEKLAINLAALALRAAVAENWDRARQAILDISDRTGEEGVSLALQGWCDTLIAHVGDKLDTTKPIKLAFKDADTGRVETADEVPATTRWSGQLLAARAADDKAAYCALLDAIPEDPKEVGAHVYALLQLVAGNLRKAAA